MSDLSEFEEKYFIDGQKYNCPFCNVRAASYSVTDDTTYNSDSKTKVYVYIVTCELCHSESIHLSNWEWNTKSYNGARSVNPFRWKPQHFNSEKLNYDEFVNGRLDEFFFYHFPTSFFTIDERIPEQIRKCISEAESCKEMNFMIGASGALRKGIYKFLKHEGVDGKKYDDKIDALKVKYPNLKVEYFDALKHIKDMNDQDMHEEDWEPFKPPEFSFLVGAIKTVLHKIYIEPKNEEKMWNKVLAFKQGRKMIAPKTEKSE